MTYPPVTPEEAWSWEEFVVTGQKLTAGRNGYDVTSPNFDAEHVTTYAVVFPQSMLFTL